MLFDTKRWPVKLRPRKLPGAVISIAVRRLANKALSTRKQCAGLFLATVRSIKELKLSEDNLGLQFHTAWSEPYFYDQSYNAVVHDGPLYIDSNGRCALAQEIAPRGENVKAKKWKCTAECKLLTPEEIKSIVELKAMFQLSIPNIRRSLDDVDGGCSYTHHSRPIITKEKEKFGACSNTSNDVVVNNCNNDVTSEKNASSSTNDNVAVDEIQKSNPSSKDVAVVKMDSDNAVYRELLGHPLPCYQVDSGCPSRLRILRAASTHYLLLRQFLGLVYTAYKNHKMVHDIDVALCEGDFSKLFQVFGIQERHFGMLLKGNADNSCRTDIIDQADDSTEQADTLQQPNLPDIESDLHIKYAHLISKQLADHPEFPW